MDHGTTDRSHRRRFLAWLGVAVVALASVTAVVPAGAAQNSSKPKNGGQLDWSLNSEAANLDPATAAGGGAGAATSGPYFQAVYDALVNYDTATGKIIPRLATELKQDSTGLIWTITLRKGVTFTDNTVFDANAVKAHWDRILNPATASPIRTTIQGWKWEVKDPQTFVVTLDGPRSNFPNLMATQLGAIPSPTAVTKFGAQYGSGPDTVVGAGPFIMTEWVRNDHMALKKNPGFWEKGKPHLDTLVFRSIFDSTTKADALRTKTIDIAYFSNADANTKALQDQGYDNYAVSAASAYGAIFNVSKPPFDDVRVRKAFVLATDAPSINLKATNDASPLAAGKPGLAWYPKESPFYDKKVKQLGPDMKEAQKLIDSYVAEKGPINTTMTIVGITSLTDLGNAMIQGWNTLKNVHVAADVQTPTIVIQRYASGDYAIGTTLTPGFNYVDEAATVLKTGSSGNTFKYSNPKMDALLTEGVQHSDLASRKKYLNDIAQVLLDDAVYSRVFYVVYFNFANSNVGNLDTGNVTVAGFPAVYDIYDNSKG